MVGGHIWLWRAQCFWSVTAALAPGARAELDAATVIGDDAVTLTERLCVQVGERPTDGCVVWRDGLCEYGEKEYPVWAEASVRDALSRMRLFGCAAENQTGCVNVTVSARAEVATVCMLENVTGGELLNLEMSKLPPGQLRLSEGQPEFNLYGNVTGDSGDRDLEINPSCSAVIMHECERASTGYIFESKYVATTGTGKVYKEGWQKQPSSVIFLLNNELMKWTATCSKSSLSVTKRHYFKAGGSTIVSDHTTSGQSVRTVYARCIALNAFCMDFKDCYRE